MKKEEILNYFNDKFDNALNVERFLTVELREKAYGLFNKRDFVAHALVIDRIDTVIDGDVLFCPYIGFIEDINKDMFESFFDYIAKLEKLTLCVFFAKDNGTYKCGCFALEGEK